VKNDFGYHFVGDGKRALMVFVVVADSLTLLDLPSIPGIPKSVGFGEIIYSILVMIYLLRGHTLAKFGIRT